MKMKRVALLTISSLLLAGSAWAAGTLPQPDADDPALGTAFTVTDTEKDAAVGNFTKAAEMVVKAGENPQPSAAPLKRGAKVGDEEITIEGQIIGYESCTKKSTLALVETTDGSIRRVELGYRGGRLLKLTPFTMKGKMKTDAVGEYLDVSHVDYKDADPYAEYQATNEKLAKAKAKMVQKGMEYKRDAAYSHTNITSDQSSYLTQHSEVVDPSDYAATTAYGVKDLAAGTKVAITGRCIMTVSTADDIVEFWDKDMKRVNLHMNGLYVPLGQRCTILGVVQEDGTISVDSMTSVAV